MFKFTEQEYLKKATKINHTHFQVMGLEPGTFFGVKVMKTDYENEAVIIAELKVQTMLEPIKQLAAETKSESAIPGQTLFKGKLSSKGVPTYFMWASLSFAALVILVISLVCWLRTYSSGLLASMTNPNLENSGSVTRTSSNTFSDTVAHAISSSIEDHRYHQIPVSSHVCLEDKERVKKLHNLSSDIEVINCK